MRKIAVNTFASLDGVMQAPGGPEEDPTGGFAHGGWSFNYWDEMMGHVMDDATARPFDLLLGRKTYEIFAAHWPHYDDSMGQKLNGAKKYVATRTLKTLDWQNSRRLGSDLRGELQRLQGAECRGNRASQEDGAGRLTAGRVIPRPIQGGITRSLLPREPIACAIRRCRRHCASREHHARFANVRAARVAGGANS